MTASRWLQLIGQFSDYHLNYRRTTARERHAAGLPVAVFGGERPIIKARRFALPGATVLTCRGLRR
jgi:hypothetical protein